MRANLWPKERAEAVEKLWVAGVSAGKIGAQFGLTKNSVLGFVSRRNLPKREVVKTPHRALGKPLPTRHKSLPLLPRPKPGRAVVPVAANQMAVTLMDLPAFGACKFPVGAATGVAQLFCAAPIDSLYLHYCDAHCRIAYLPMAARKKEAA